jgi:quinohemoprotein ethanol dehydrogenase
MVLSGDMRFGEHKLIRTSTLTSGLGAFVFGIMAATAHSDPAAAPAANVTAQRLLHADSEPSQWLTYGGDYNEQRYSRLTQITRANVKQLGLKWFADYDTNLSQDGTPLYIDGVIYTTTAWTKVYAFDAATGKTLW